MKPKKAKKRNKQDATLRNNKARVKEIAALRKRVDILEQAVDAIIRDVVAMYVPVTQKKSNGKRR